MMKYLKFATVLILLFSGNRVRTQQCYAGTTMEVALYLQNTCGIVYKENGIAKNPFQSIKDHGGNIVRFRQDMPPFSNDFIQNEPPVDYRSPDKVLVGMQAAKDAGLKTLLTLSYQSFALDDAEALNPYVAPLAWQSIADDLIKLSDSVYNYTFNTLSKLVESGFIPEIVSVGNETNWRILEPNLPENQLPEYDPQRTVTLLNAGTSAIRKINDDFGLNIRIALHIFGASNLEWWMDTHVPLGLDFDIMGLSHYHAWHTLGSFANWTAVVEWVKTNHQKDFLIMETAQLFSSGYSDNRANVLGIENIPGGYPNPPTTQTQKEYLVDLTTEVIDAGGLGTIVWGGDWVGSDCYVFPDEYGPGSSWENKTFWDFSVNLHNGIDWMKESCPQNSISVYKFGQEIEIFPIPVTSNKLTILTRNCHVTRIEIYSIDGRLINSIAFELPENNKKTLTLAGQNIQSGMYLVSIFTHQGNPVYRRIPVLLKN